MPVAFVPVLFVKTNVIVATAPTSNTLAENDFNRYSQQIETPDAAVGPVRLHWSKSPYSLYWCAPHSWHLLLARKLCSFPWRNRGAWVHANGTATGDSACNSCRGVDPPVQTTLRRWRSSIRNAAG